MQLSSRAFVLFASPALLAACAAAAVGPPVRRRGSASVTTGNTGSSTRCGGARPQIDAGSLRRPAMSRRCEVHVDGGLRTEWIDELDAAGGLACRNAGRSVAAALHPAAALVAFPLEQGKVWRQTVRRSLRHRAARPVLIDGDVQGRTPVAVPAGSFDAVQIYRYCSSTTRSPGGRDHPPRSALVRTRSQRTSCANARSAIFRARRQRRDGGRHRTDDDGVGVVPSRTRVAHGVRAGQRLGAFRGRAAARSSPSARLIQRVEVQPGRAAREQAVAQSSRDDVEAERADRRACRRRSFRACAGSSAESRRRTRRRSARAW